MTRPSTAHPRRTLRHGADLAAAGLVPPEQVSEIDRVAARYHMAITPTLADLIDPSDPADPIARQFVPDAAELEAAPAERDDPIGDEAFSPLKGIVHRYPDRVLLTPLLHCPLYCRFCFRREKVGGAQGALSPSELEAALGYIRAHEEVWEVVVTGGDPLMLPPARMKALTAALEGIPHVATIRFHSRIPIGDPERVGPELIAALQTDKALWLAVHANHPREFSAPACAALRRLARAGIPLVGQTVLLKGVNDDPAVMEALLRAMVANRVKPYYLHQLDLARGTERFRVPIEDGQALVRSLRGRVSGLCQPTYVLDIPGGYGKVPLTPQFRDGATVTDWQGRRHPYPPR